MMNPKIFWISFGLAMVVQVMSSPVSKHKTGGMKATADEAKDLEVELRKQAGEGKKDSNKAIPAPMQPDVDESGAVQDDADLQKIIFSLQQHAKGMKREEEIEERKRRIGSGDSHEDDHGRSRHRKNTNLRKRDHDDEERKRDHDDKRDNDERGHKRDRDDKRKSKHNPKKLKEHEQIKEPEMQKVNEHQRKKGDHKGKENNKEVTHHQKREDGNQHHNRNRDDDQDKRVDASQHRFRGNNYDQKIDNRNEYNRLESKRQQVKVEDYDPEYFYDKNNEFWEDLLNKDIKREEIPKDMFGDDKRYRDNDDRSPGHIVKKFHM